MIALDTNWDGCAAFVLGTRIGPFEARASWTVELHGPRIGRRDECQDTECELHFRKVVDRLFQGCKLNSMLKFSPFTNYPSIFIEPSGVICTPSYENFRPHLGL